MMTTTLLYIFVILLLFFSPLKLWDFPVAVVGYAHKLKKSKSSISLIQRGESLLGIFSTLESNMAQGKNVITQDICDYKFFTKLIFTLIDYQRKLGLGLKLILPDIRKNLSLDIRFEKKMKSQRLGAYYQFILITIMSWFFVIFSGHIISYTPKVSILISIAFLQAIGFVLFSFGLSFLYKKMFYMFDSLIESLYLFITLIDVGLPMAQVLNHSKILDERHYEHKDFLAIQMRLKTLIERWKAMGLSPKLEAQEILEDLWELKNTFFERFLKILDGIKFGILVIFFMPAYFLYLYSIFQFFMEQ